MAAGQGRVHPAKLYPIVEVVSMWKKVSQPEPARGKAFRITTCNADHATSLCNLTEPRFSRREDLGLSRRYA